MKHHALAGFQVVGYADEILLIGRGPFIHTVLERFQEVVVIVERWCISRELSVNPDKSVSIRCLH